MSDYNKRRWDWTREKSLKRIRWDDIEGVLVSLAIIVIPAVLGWFALGSVDLVPKALLSLAATVLVLVALVGANWLRAPAALDAAREAEVDKLRQEIAALTKSGSPDRIAELEARLKAVEQWTLTDEQLAAIAAVIKTEKAGVYITLDVASPKLDSVYSQTVALFREAGWSVFTDTVLDGGNSGDDPNHVETPVTVIVRTDTPQSTVEIVERALQAAHIPFTEVRRPEPLSRGIPQIAFASTPI